MTALVFSRGVPGGSSSAIISSALSDSVMNSPPIKGTSKAESMKSAQEMTTTSQRLFRDLSTSLP